MPKFEKFSNNASDQLSSGINDTVTVLTLSDAGEFPSDGNFRILIEDELLLVTAVSGDDFTVVRGIEGTTAATHSASTQVDLIVTKKSVQAHLAGAIPLFGMNQQVGPLNSLTDTSGNALTSASFSWVNQGSATVTDPSSGCMQLTPPTGTGSNLRMLVRSAPSTPYTIYAAFSPVTTMDGTVNHCGMCMRESGSSLVVVNALSSEIVSGDHQPFQLSLGRYNNPTSFNSWVHEFNCNWNPNLVWLFCADNGTNISFGMSCNGYNFITHYTETRGNFFSSAPDQVGFYFNTNSNAHPQALLVNHWSEQ